MIFLLSNQGTTFTKKHKTVPLLILKIKPTNTSKYQLGMKCD